ncbi:MAG: chorismate mutase [Clostridia bacterium]|nr:chorismate mutase [Clostridia bacterium]
MKDVKELRNGIDKIDNQLTNLYIERLKLCKEIGLLKAQTKSSVDVPLREKEIINKVTSLADDELKIYVKNLYESIFSQSKAYQNSFIVENTEIVQKIKQCLNNKINDLPVSATVACQGVEGAYSGIATEKLFKISNITYFKDFESVFNAVDKGLCEYGILPIENSTAGSVLSVYDLITKHNFYIVKSIKMQISHVFAVKHSTNVNNVKAVYSHEQALNQCSEFINKNKYDRVANENTAVSAKFVAESEREDIGVICSEQCAKIYGLKIVEKGVQNVSNNYTRFICISKNMQVVSGADKISVVTSLENKAGNLNKLLNKFASQGLNLTKLESRPIPNCQFEFMFYFDFEGDLENAGVMNLISELDNSSDKFVFLGCYKEII